jgi:hypothetical protein
MMISIPNLLFRSTARSTLGLPIFAHLVVTTNSGPLVHVVEPELVTSQTRGVLAAVMPHPDAVRSRP